jgi:hypothetical protein
VRHRTERCFLNLVVLYMPAMQHMYFNSPFATSPLALTLQAHMGGTPILRSRTRISTWYLILSTSPPSPTRPARLVSPLPARRIRRTPDVARDHVCPRRPGKSYEVNVKQNRSSSGYCCQCICEARRWWARSKRYDSTGVEVWDQRAMTHAQDERASDWCSRLLSKFCVGNLDQTCRRPSEESSR